MKPIDQSELSGYLDGELDEIRANEIEAALSHDLALQQALISLTTFDEQWKKAAHAASFSPQRKLLSFEKCSLSTSALIAIALVFAAVRLLPKLMMLEWGFALHALALAIALISIARSLSKATT